ncbi:MAG: hypothetical protein KKC03_05390 [Bacteroidetes bacterium]|nr:hypothetical protein [Bacteroidota bacterium]
MKTLFKPLFFLYLVGIFLVGCQSDSAEIISESPDDNITASSELAVLLQASSENNGAIDDFIDGISATSVVFPYVVETDFGTQTITSVDGLLQFKQTLQASASTSSNPPQIKFPFKVRFKDHSEREIKNDDDWNDHLSKENDDDEDDFRDRIKCFEINYPVTLLLFNTNQEQTGSVVVNNNRELFAFFTQLPPSIVVSIDYPISITFRDGNTLQLENNRELLRVMLECRNSDDDDDDDTIDDDIPSNLRETAFELRRTLLANDWFVTEFINEGTDRSEVFQDVKFQFFFGGGVKVIRGNVFAFGRWEIELDDDTNRLKVDLDFRDDVQILEILDEDWLVMEFSNALLNLKEDDNDNTTLKLEGTPNQGDGSGGDTGGGDDTGNPNLDAFKANLLGEWVLAAFTNDNNDDSSNFSGFTFTFNADGSLKAEKVENDEIHIATWFIEVDFNALELHIQFPEVDPVDELNEDWLIVSSTETRIVLEHANSDGTKDRLVFER